MNNVIPLRPDPLRQAYEATDKLNDTKLSPGQQQLVDSIASYLEKAIELRDGPDLISTPLHVIEDKWQKHFGLNPETKNGEEDLPPAG